MTLVFVVGNLSLFMRNCLVLLRLEKQILFCDCSFLSAKQIKCCYRFMPLKLLGIRVNQTAYCVIPVAGDICKPDFRHDSVFQFGVFRLTVSPS